MQNEFQQSLQEMLPKVGSPDLILITGDLTNSGSIEEFELVDQFLNTLLVWLREVGVSPDPIVIPVRKTMI